MTRLTAKEACEEPGVVPEDLDVVEVHNAFSAEEPMYPEAMGVCP